MTSSDDLQAYVIRQGDRLSSLAATMGFDEREVWEHERNRELRERRESSEILAPGDVLFVPTPAAHEMNLTAKTTNRYKANMPSRRVDVVVGFGAAPLADEPFEVQWGTRAPQTHRTDREGHARFSVPAHLREVTLVLPNHDTAMVLQLGHLNPRGVRSGAIQRLANRGYLAAGRLFPPGLSRGNAVDEETLALRRFQRDQGLRDTGELDEGTVAALAEDSDS